MFDFNVLSCTYSRYNLKSKIMYSKIILFLLLPIFAFSQAPQKINFQSILRNTNGAVVSDKSVSLKISILSGSISGSIVYTETHTKTTDQSGLISLQIGNGTVLSGVFANISWGDFPHFIKLEADFSGGNNFVLLGTQELMSVPYALYASKTDTSSLNLVNRFNSKVNVSDTSNMLSNYRTGLNSKVNIADTSNMLSNYRTGLNEKVNVSDTSTMLSNYRTGLNNKVNVSDTASMLANYQTGLNNKVNVSDTSDMLANYKTIITDLQKQVELLSSYTSLLASGLVDIDGNNYPVVKIGNQIWMKENLRVSRYRNGDIIPIVTYYPSGIPNETNGTRSWYDNDSTSNAIPFGNLYNGLSLEDARGLCPEGWDIPTEDDLNSLVTNLGGRLVAGRKLKETGNKFWTNPNDATNESGFSALPSLWDEFGYIWGSTQKVVQFGEIYNVAIGFWNASSVAAVTFNNKQTEAFIRCLKNE